MLRLIKFSILYFWGDPKLRVNFYLRLIIFFRDRNNKKVAKFLSNRLFRIQKIIISPQAQFDSTLDLRHPIGNVVGDGVKIGRNVVLFQNVTLGGARVGDAKQNNFPTIGDNTVVFSGAVIVGRISIGANCTIGANSVVISDVPDGCTAVGAPARIVRR